MARWTCLALLLAALSGTIAPRAMAQEPVAAPAPPRFARTTGSSEANPLLGLPRPPDQPASLLAPAPAEPVYGCPQRERPYFEQDPLLDLSCRPQPGWLFDVELGLLGSKVIERLGQTSPPGQITVAVPGTGHTSDVVSVPMATLDWTAAPRVEFGYRLPSGFGELDVAYRFLVTQGSGSTLAGSDASPDAAAALRSRLDVNVLDLDYASHETSLGPCWDMKWRIGLRYADVFFDSRADEPFAAAASGSGIFERSISNNFWGIGPHAALELKRRRSPCGLGWVGRLDGTILFGQVDQQFAEVSTTHGADGSLLSGTTELVNIQQVPMLSGFLGLDWRPPRYSNLDLLVGYNAEYWWNVGRLSDPDLYNGQSAGEMGAHGPVFRLEYNY